MRTSATVPCDPPDRQPDELGLRKSLLTAWRSGVTSWLLLVALLVAVIGWIARLYPAAPDWGSVAEWFGATSTFTAVAVSLVVAKRSIDQAERAQEQSQKMALAAQEHEKTWRKAEEARRSLEDARKLSWWVSDLLSVQDPPKELRPFLDEAHDRTYGVNIDPDLSVAVAVVTISNLGDTAFYSARLLESDAAVDLGHDSLRPIGVIPPGETTMGVRVVSGGTPYSDVSMKVAIGNNLGVAWIEYRDVNGQHWRRLADGTLSEQFSH